MENEMTKMRKLELENGNGIILLRPISSMGEQIQLGPPIAISFFIFIQITRKQKQKKHGKKNAESKKENLKTHIRIQFSMIGEIPGERVRGCCVLNKRKESIKATAQLENYSKYSDLDSFDFGQLNVCMVDCVWVLKSLIFYFFLFFILLVCSGICVRSNCFFIFFVVA